MKTMDVCFRLVLPVLAVGMTVGCVGLRKEPSPDVYAQLDIKDSEIRRLNAALESRRAEPAVRLEPVGEGSIFLPPRKDPVEEADTAGETADAAAQLLPPNAKPGECYARVYIPPSYGMVEERVLVQEAGERVEIIPAQFEWVEEDVVVKEATTRIEVVPATYEMREEQVMVTPPSTRVEEVPAEYVWTEERVLVKPAHTEWKKGRGPIEQIDNATGEIMCLVEVPAEYKTVKKQVLKSPARTRTIEVPAEYTTVEKKVMVTPETTRMVEIPAETKRVRMKKLVAPERKRTIPIEAKYQVVEKQVVDETGGIGWRRVLCETNLSADIVKQVQRALVDAGEDPGPIDGIIGTQTQAAIQTFQGANGLAVGGLTFETLNRLGVKVERSVN